MVESMVGSFSIIGGISGEEACTGIITSLSSPSIEFRNLEEITSELEESSDISNILPFIEEQFSAENLAEMITRITLEEEDKALGESLTDLFAGFGIETIETLTMYIRGGVTQDGAIRLSLLSLCPDLIVEPDQLDSLVTIFSSMGGKALGLLLAEVGSGGSIDGLLRMIFAKQDNQIRNALAEHLKNIKGIDIHNIFLFLNRYPDLKESFQNKINELSLHFKQSFKVEVGPRKSYLDQQDFQCIVKKLTDQSNASHWLVNLYARNAN